MTTTKAPQITKASKRKLKRPTPDCIEQKRLEALMLYEEEARFARHRAIVGVDEAGRGPLAGPVVAAACMLPQDKYIVGVNDSKKLTPKQRKELYHQITNDPEICFGIGLACHEEIDQINIYQATIKAMWRAIENLSVSPDFLLVDGMFLEHPTLPCRKIIKGDSKSQSIAAASVIAKEYRDTLMCEYDQKWPEYGFAKHKGYGTLEHRQAIFKYGRSPIHRKTFSVNL